MSAAPSNPLDIERSDIRSSRQKLTLLVTMGRLMSHICTMYGVRIDRVLNEEHGMHMQCACGRTGYQSYAMQGDTVGDVVVTVSRRWSVYGVQFAEVTRVDGLPWFWQKGVPSFGIPDAPVTRLTISV